MQQLNVPCKLATSPLPAPSTSRSRLPWYIELDSVRPDKEKVQEKSEEQTGGTGTASVLSCTRPERGNKESPPRRKEEECNARRFPTSPKGHAPPPLSGRSKRKEPHEPSLPLPMLLLSYPVSLPWYHTNAESCDRNARSPTPPDPPWSPSGAASSRQSSAY